MEGTSKTHTWMIMLLVWIMILVMFAVGYQIYRNEIAVPSEELSSAELADACADAVQGRLENTEEEPVCPEPENPTYAATADMPGFTYPLGWHITINGTPSSENLFADSKPIAIFQDTEGPRVPLVITSRVIMTGAKPTEAYLLSLEDDAIYSDIVKSSTKISNGTVTTVRGHVKGLYDEDFETVLFEGASHAITVTFYDTDASATEMNDAWSLIKSSLDFSKIH